MRAGKLDQRIAIQRKTTAFNTYHEPIETWADLFTTWAEAITSGGGEFSAAQSSMQMHLWYFAFGTTVCHQPLQSST